MSVLFAIQNWFQSQCDGDWEHGFGVKIETLDNPGWKVEINLQETNMENKVFTEIEDLAPDQSWIHCRVVDGKFKGYGGALMLENILITFLNWACPEWKEQIK